MKKEIVMALAGNPNSGKTTIFNNITGARQHVGNYPGVTVERKEGRAVRDGIEIRVVDLPGTYSLTAYSAEEVVARNFIVDEKPDVVVNIVDASNLERNLYLSVQLMELEAPLVIVFNMADMARERGLKFDIVKMSKLFGAPIVEAVGSKNVGTGEIMNAVVKKAGEGNNEPRKIFYGDVVEKSVEVLIPLLKEYVPESSKYGFRWVAVKLLEGDKDVTAKITLPVVLETVKRQSEKIEELLGMPPETAIAEARYGFISGALRECVSYTIEERVSVSDSIDKIVANRFLGIPIFLILMYLVFQLTFTIGDPFMTLIEDGFAKLGTFVDSLYPPESESIIKSLIVDGIIGGVGGVIVFLPNILLLFLAISILEATGYMARVAFIMDKVMHKIGLHGKSFIPLLIGFGCSVPAIMATRTLENKRDRIITMLVAPLMSCGARLPIYALIIPAFFPDKWNAPMLWIIYVIGIVLAIVTAKILGITILKGESMPFVMELPPYRTPTFKGVFLQTWERGWLYLKKAGSIILGISILLWALTTFPKLPESVQAGYDEKIEAIAAAADMAPETKAKAEGEIENDRGEHELIYSYAGRIGNFIEPVLKPMGFDWKIGTALIGAIAAKEVFVAQMGIVYSVGEADEESVPLREKLAAAYTPLVGFCIMLFCLVSAPCMATLAITRRESGSWKWAFLQWGGLTFLAFILTTLVYQIGFRFGIGV